jgi:hypothetical protein
MIDDQHNLPDSEYIIIPNPIYDVVFRYLMEDPESATIVLSTLINEKITSLQLEPQTHAQKNEIETKISDPKSKKDVQLFHLDFTATVELPDGSEELIMIELQKASEPDDIFRFKRYISKNFQKKHEKEIIHPVSHTVEKILKPIRLIPIFILNFRIENEINDLLIRTNRIKTGVFKNKTLQKTNEFIDNLSYDILVVQLPNLHNITESEYENDEYKKKLYALLKIFDQKSKVKDNEHRLRLIRKFFPGFLERVIKRLQAADINNPVMEKQMFAEDEYLKALIKRDNQITWLEEGIEKRDKTIEEKEKAIEEKDKALSETRRIIFELAKTLKDSGFSMEVIIEKTGLSTEEIENL